MFTPADIRRYYDRNTAVFVARGQGGDEGAIHRAVWGPEVSSRSEAFHYVHDQIAQLIGSLPGAAAGSRVLDLGCGVAGTLCYLAQRLPLSGVGVTISPVQAEIGAARIAAAGLAARLTCIEGDYCALPEGLGQFDLAFAIESFVHGPSPDRFFSEAARHLRPGGLLVVCDDVRRGQGGAAERALEQFARGWHVNSLLTREQLRAVAARAGLIHERTDDLTPYLELDRPRDRAIAAFTAVVSRLPVRSTLLAPLVGGTALQRALKRGWLSYDFTVFRRA